MLCGMPNGTIYYGLPGGGQNKYETLEDALRREVLEETGYTIAVKRLSAVYEEISTNQEYREVYGQFAHGVYFLFACQMIDEPVKSLTEKDLNMLEAKWVDIKGVNDDFPLFPRAIRYSLGQILASESTIYFGAEYV